MAPDVGISMKPGEQPAAAEHRRLAEPTGRAEDDLFVANPWNGWGPYLSDRAGGMVREDHGNNGDACIPFPHDHARPAVLDFFHGDVGTGRGAAHQTGWTALVADLILDRLTMRKPGAASLPDDVPPITRDLIGPT